METADTDSCLKGNEETCLKFLELVTPLIQENLTGLRKGVTSYELLSAALICFASRMDYEDVMFRVAVKCSTYLFGYQDEL